MGASLRPERRLLVQKRYSNRRIAMTRVVPFAVAAATFATLSACSTPPQTGPSIVTNVHPYTAGSGTVQQVFPAPVMAGAGSSAEPMQRLEIKMDNGSIQYVDTPSREFTKGARVTLTEDQLIRKM
jgi:hypothetical protein